MTVNPNPRQIDLKPADVNEMKVRLYRARALFESMSSQFTLVPANRRSPAMLRLLELIADSQENVNMALTLLDKV